MNKQISFIKKKKGGILLSLLLMVLLVWLSIASTIGGEAKTLAINGVLDLRAQDLSQKTVALDGEWKFVWEELLEPGALNKPVSIMSLPKTWNGFEYKDEKLSANGYATFQLEVVLSPELKGQNLALFIPYVHSSYKLFIDKSPILNIGEVGKSLDDFKPSARSVMLPFQTELDTLTITLQVANYAYSMGGIWQSIRLGKHDMVRAFYDRQLAFDLFILGGLLLMGLYHIALYFLRKSVKSNLYFGLICILFALKNLFTGTVFVYTLLPDVSYELCLKVIYISLFGPTLLFWLFLRELFIKEFPLLLSKVLSVVIAICISIILFSPVHIFSYLMIPFWLIVSFSMVFILRGFYFALRHKREGAVIIVSGVFFFLFTVLHDIAIDLNLIQSAYLAGAGFFILIFSQALLLAVKFTKSFENVEKLTLEKQKILLGQKEKLEKEVDIQTQKIRKQHQEVIKQKKRSEELLLNILPEEVAEELKEQGKAKARHFDNVTVLFTDFKGFTALSEQVSPEELVYDLHECFSEFDAICEKYGVEKIKTIGDAYMAAGGLPSPNTTHAEDTLKAALEMARVVEEAKLKKMASNRPFFEIRIGIHTGPVVAGIVGLKKFAYDIWGDTVNTASRIESSGQVGEVNISHNTYEILKSNSQFFFESRGKVMAKGKGEIEMYFARMGVSQK